ncbi:MAG: C-type lectin domain-containing protein [Reichenbachiella sp.]|uniref:C-type lectin domain-containing protein n=1 Tax=Reichenbachiella sp. TaxID=2184521 RepID=UPI0029674CA2|nr:C-type lectin domain-containing protein [Reichenbachiella sp.]MDW3209402.1 C-type lectin domain-containing protein [Reichenbachiella sp.]
MNNLRLITMALLMAMISCSDDDESEQQDDGNSTIESYSFTYNETEYEVILEKMSWKEAAAYAKENGGYLAEINSQEEQNTLFTELSKNAGITLTRTTASDGGGASYVWIGGNDMGTEGKWMWDGSNAGSGTQFWQGLADGATVGGLYNNWGDEPDDFEGNQDALGFALTDWPLGVAGEWNDLRDSNRLYFLIEY